MKPLLITLTILCMSFNIQAQDIIFNINQTTLSEKNVDTKRYEESEVKSADVYITLEDKTVTFYNGETVSTISLDKMNNQNNNINHLYSQSWKAFDSRKNPLQFKYTVNVENKEAIVEVIYKDYKSYYFGKFNYGNLNNQASKLAEVSNIRN